MKRISLFESLTLAGGLLAMALAAAPAWGQQTKDGPAWPARLDAERPVGQGGPAAACSIVNIQGGLAAGYLAWPTPGGVLMVYFDPAASGDPGSPGCGDPAPYPFWIDTVDVLFADASLFGAPAGAGLGNLTFSIDISCPTIGGAPCSEPGTELFKSADLTLVADDTGFHPVSVPVEVCVAGPFFVSIHFRSWDGDPGLVPSPLWDAEPRPPCRQWISTDDGGTWVDFTDFFATGATGWVDVTVNGNTQDICDPAGACEATGPPMGACCAMDGTCSITTEANCGLFGGTYIGDGTICLGDNNMDGFDDVCVPPIPPNDDCIDRITITDGTIAFDLFGATADPSAPIWDCGSSSTNDIWYNYTATCDGTVTIDTIGSGNDTVLEVYSGFTCPPDVLNLLDCDDDGGGFPPGESAISLPVTAGDELKIRVGGWGGTQFLGVLNVACIPAGAPEACCFPDGSCQDLLPDDCTMMGGTPQGPGTDCSTIDCPPANDDCEGRITVGDGTTNFDLAGATTDPTAPLWSCGSSASNDLWYNYTASCSGTVTIDTIGTGSDTVLEVYSGFACPPSIFVACDDDGGGFPPGESALALPVTAGDELKIRVGGWGGQQFPGVLNIACSAEPQACCFSDGSCLDLLPADCTDMGGIPQGVGTDCGTTVCPIAPPNDDCADRIEIGEGLTFYDTTNASTDGAELDPAVCDPGTSGDDQIHNDVWYNFTAPCTGLLTATTCEELGGFATYDTRLAVYDGTTCPADPATCLGANDDDPDNLCGTGAGGFHSTVIVPVISGNEYKIRVGGFGPGSAGTGGLFLLVDADKDPTLQLDHINPDPTGYQPGEELQVTLNMRHLCPEEAAGYQAYLIFDPAKMILKNAVYTAEPFGLHIVAVDPGQVNMTGELDVAAGVDPQVPQDPESADSLLMTYTFTAQMNICRPEITFRPNNPPTRITDLGGNEILPLQLKGLEPSCKGDTNFDGTVDVDDLTNVILTWGTDACLADTNLDGIVDVDDLTQIILAWGDCP